MPDRSAGTQRQIVVWFASRPRSLSSSSTSRNESEYRRYQRTAQRISSGSVCRHLKIAGRIACFMISSGHPPSAKVATQPLELPGPTTARVLSSECSVRVLHQDGRQLRLSRAIKGDNTVVHVEEHDNGSAIRQSKLLARRQTMQDDHGGLQRFLFD